MSAYLNTQLNVNAIIFGFEKKFYNIRLSAFMYFEKIHEYNNLRMGEKKIGDRSRCYKWILFFFSYHLFYLALLCFVHVQNRNHAFFEWIENIRAHAKSET